MELLKVRTSDSKEIAMALYTNDTGFLALLDPDPVQAMTIALSYVEYNMADGVFYKVQGEGGELIGFFIVFPKAKAQKKIKLFYIKENARTPEYQKAFYELMSQTIYGEVYASLTRLNIPNIDVILKDKFTILEPYKPYGSIL
jgi:hypothetical protein